MTRTLRALRTAVGTAAVALLLAPATANAYVINFDQVEQGGTVTPIGGGNFVGTDIVFEFITYEDPIGNVLSTVYCGQRELDNMGNLSQATDTNCLLNFNTATNDFVVTATAGLFDSDGNAIAGSVAGMEVLRGTIDGFGMIGPNFSSFGPDTKHEALLAYFGVTDTNFQYGNTEILLDEANPTLVTNADISNMPVEVPEAGMLALFGLGLLGLGRRLTRRKE